jgi:hypothetical protein
MTESPPYDPQDTRTLPLHPAITGRRIEAVLPDGSEAHPQADGLFEYELPLLTTIYVDGEGWRKIAPDGQLGPPLGFLTPQEAAVDLYPDPAQARAVDVEIMGDEAHVVVDTLPSHPLRAVCVLDNGLWVPDVTRSENVE